MSWRILQGDCLEVLRTLESGSVQTCVTSPPYWGLRDYGTAEWEGGDSECDHTDRPRISEKTSIGRSHGGTGAIQPHIPSATLGVPYREVCAKCGAKRIDSQLGLEPTPEQYVENLVSVFREVRRVLRDDGTVWLNLGDSYAAQGGSKEANAYEGKRVSAADWQPPRSPTPGLKAKDLVGIPWRVAFALQADGWWLRSDIIWAKPNPMPESVIDRPTRAHEYTFLLTKSARYFYDADAIREEHLTADDSRNGDHYEASRERNVGGRTDGLTRTSGAASWPTAGRNKRSVWTVTTQPYPEAHFATFPPKLVEPCILAGSPPKCCGECGAPWERVVELIGGQTTGRTAAQMEAAAAKGIPHSRMPVNGSVGQYQADHVTDGWRSTCEHHAPFIPECPNCGLECRDHVSYESVRDMRSGVRETGLAEEAVLQPDMREPLPLTAESDGEGEIHDQQRLRLDSSAESSERIEGRLRHGTPASDGTDTRSGDPAERSGASPEREQVGQPPGESAGDAEAETRQAPEAASQDGDESVSALREGGQANGTCPRCSSALERRRSVVLDIFCGSGTTGVVALRHNRDFIGIELNPEYCEMARNRIRDDAPLFNTHTEGERVHASSPEPGPPAA